MFFLDIDGHLNYEYAGMPQNNLILYSLKEPDTLDYHNKTNMSFIVFTNSLNLTHLFVTDVKTLHQLVSVVIYGRM